MGERLLRVEEVALLVGVSFQTINIWYRWKAQNPDHELAKLLPDYVQNGPTGPRLWKREDVYKLIQFNVTKPKGPSGVMGSVTQKYVKKEKKNGTA